MKKQIALVFTLAACLMSACDDENPTIPMTPHQGTIPVQGNTTPFPRDTKPEPAIYAVHPSAGASGSTVVIFGTNFGSAISGNYVTFGSSYAEVTYVSSGMITVRVPNLADGDYEIMVNADGQIRRAPQMFTITNSQD